MKITRLFATLLLLLSIGITTPLLAQVGGRKKEHRNQRGGGMRLFKRSKSSGHADSFAKGGKRGFIARIFGGKKDGSAWVYKRTNPGVKQNREQGQLFTRNRTKAKRYRDGIIAQQNKRRDATRVRGNTSFGKRKH